MIPSQRLQFVAPLVVAAAVLSPHDAFAQRGGRHVVVRTAPVRTVVVGASRAPYAPYYYDPFFFDRYGYQARPYPPYGGYAYQPGADLRIQVTPREAEVYIDGYLVGNVDDFDGVFQRLRVPFGEHEISIYQEGFRTLSEKMLFRPYQSYHLKQAMEPIAAGEPAPTRPAPAAGAAARPGPAARPDGSRSGVRSNERPPRAGEAGRGSDRFGAVAVRVQPRDAVILVDDERWDAPEGADRLLVELAEGAHRVEVRKEGYRTYRSTVRIDAGQTSSINISLPPDR